MDSCLSSFSDQVLVFIPPIAVYFACLMILSIYPKNDNAVYIKKYSSFIETFLLLKTTRFVNAPSGIWYFIQALGKAALFVLLSLLVNFFYVQKFKSVLAGGQSQHDPLMLSGTIMILVVAFYWNERKEYVEKWRYLAELYNSSLAHTSKAHRDFIIRSLVHDIHRTGMWSHNTFQDIFLNAIKEVTKQEIGSVVLTNDQVESIIGEYAEIKARAFVDENNSKRETQGQ